jgi:hypothetical protein
MKVLEQVVSHFTLNLMIPTSSILIPPPLSSSHLSFKIYLQVPKSLSQTQFTLSVLYQTYFYIVVKMHTNLLFTATQTITLIIHVKFAFLYSL